MAWLAVAEIQHHQIQSELNADAQAIAAQPDQWLQRLRVVPARTTSRPRPRGRTSWARGGRSWTPTPR